MGGLVRGPWLGGGYHGGASADDVPPPSRIPSATIKGPTVPIANLGGDHPRTQTLYVALLHAWHDTTCPEGPDCRDRALHLLAASGVERAGRLAGHPALQQILAGSSVEPS